MFSIFSQPKLFSQPSIQMPQTNVYENRGTTNERVIYHKGGPSSSLPQARVTNPNVVYRREPQISPSEYEALEAEFNRVYGLPVQNTQPIESFNGDIFQKFNLNRFKSGDSSKLLKILKSYLMKIAFTAFRYTSDDSIIWEVKSLKYFNSNDYYSLRKKFLQKYELITDSQYNEHKFVIEKLSKAYDGFLETVRTTINNPLNIVSVIDAEILINLTIPTRGKYTLKNQ